jgi:hypothetical protein
MFINGTVLTKSNHVNEARFSRWVQRCDAGIQCVLHRICYSNIAHMRASSVQHTRDIYAGFAQHPHNIRVASA